MPVAMRRSPTRVRANIAALLAVSFISSLCLPYSTAARSSVIPVATKMQQQSVAKYQNGELLVRFRTAVSKRDRDLIIASHGARKKKDLAGESGIEKLELPNGSDVRTVAWQMLLNQQVDFAEPNFIVSKEDLTPNDPQFNQQWALQNTGQNDGQWFRRQG